MPKHLVIVESPAKARTINKFLGSNYVVRASYGHVRDLPKSTLGVDIDNGFEPKYVRPREASDAMKAITAAAKKVDSIILASDPDREGEAIGWHVGELLKKLDKPIKRVTFNAITKKSVKDAVKEPREIDQNLVDAQQARRILDRLVGYKLSPLLQWGIRRGLSAGRVQSVATRMVCDREAEIRAFVVEEYWTLDAELKTEKDESFTARLNQLDGEKPVLPDEATTKALMHRLTNAQFAVDNVERKEVRRRPYAPFITSSLQQEASRKLRFNPRRTMRIAQQLYEGIDLGSEGRVGLITYMRTDSTRIDPEGLAEVRAYIKGAFPPAMLPEKPNFFKSKKGAQDAHEAIRPTSAMRTPEQVQDKLDADQLKVYTLIWQRFVASQMMPAVFDQMTVDVAADTANFRAVGTVMKFPGFTALYEETKDDAKEEDNESKRLPDMQPRQNLNLDKYVPEQHFTKPPARYSEATLIRALEENGIGRPSTYAPTVNTIVERGYVDREKGRLKPTELGEQVNKLLVENFPDILNTNFTARMEDDLDHVEEGRLSWRELLAEFYAPFSKDLHEAQHKMVADIVQDDSPCPNCGSPMEVREGRFGIFVACEKYPECKTTRRPPREEPQPTDETCDQCGAPMVIRNGRFGKFMACSTYPECKNSYNLDKDGNKVVRAPKEPPKKTDQECPKCKKGNLVIRTSRAGEEFYGCETYPRCKFTKPMELHLSCPREGCDGELERKLVKRRRAIGCTKCDLLAFGQLDKSTPCEKCGLGWTTVMKPRNKPRVRTCHNPSCGHTIELPEDDQDQ